MFTHSLSLCHNKNLMVLLCLSAILLLPFCGCSYLKARLYDTLDIVRVDAGAGIGFGAEVYATQFCATGIGCARGGYYVELIGPRMGLWRYDYAVFAVALLFNGKFCHFEEPRGIIGRTFLPQYPQYDFWAFGSLLSLLVKGKVPMERVAGIDGVSMGVEDLREFATDTNSTIFEVGLRIHGPIYIRVGVCLDELLDWLLGWFSIDIMADDGPTPSAASPDPLNLLPKPESEEKESIEEADEVP